MNTNFDLNPGPIDNRILYLEDQHRARSLFLNPDSGNKCVLDIKRGDRAFWLLAYDDANRDRDFVLPSRIVKYIKDFGFGGIVQCKYKKLDRGLIESLVERWRPETNTFHLPIGEVTVTLEDVNVLWGLPIEGMALTGVEDIENIYGTWEYNFFELPSYIMALQQSNPGTVVQWLHHPHSPSDCSVFKYVFWAFRPSIEAFQYCIPVISIDAAHLRGTYKGKLLLAVSKNANNMILPLAYALVDEETNDSWKWFLQQFADHVADPANRTLCVISDRHAAIKHAMDNLQSWKKPNAYHRFCLRHVKSNFMHNFKSVALKTMCWEIGSTTQQRKYDRLMSELKTTNKQAWKYLQDIDKSKWTVLYDQGNRRWGVLTTNISESMNNVLRGARLLPIKALIEYTFKRDVEQYAKNWEIAYNCSTEFAPKMWTLFHAREVRAQQHRVYPYSARDQRFMVETNLQTSDETGGSPYTVEYNERTCSCGKWQIYRFPCSHAIAVAQYLRVNPKSTANERFTTEVYRAQYNHQYFPVPHKEDWEYAGWRLHADPSKITVVRGRRRARRFQNEMDKSYAEEKTTRKCSGCKQPGHRINNCPNRQN